MAGDGLFLRPTVHAAQYSDELTRPVPAARIQGMKVSTMYGIAGIALFALAIWSLLDNGRLVSTLGFLAASFVTSFTAYQRARRPPA